jgi:adenylate cyclase
VPTDYVDRLIELGLLERPSGGSGFSTADVRRVRLIRGLEEGGLALDGMAKVVREGELSFDFLELPTWEWYGGFAGKTYRQVSEESGLSLEMLRAMREAMGFAWPGSDASVHDEELNVLPLLQAVLEVGVSPASVQHLMRVWGESMRRIVESASFFYRTEVVSPLLAGGMGEAQALLVANQAMALGIPTIDRALVSMYHGHSEYTWLANIVEMVEAIMEKAGLHHAVAEPPAMCFLDLSGFTSLTEERGDRVAAEIASTLGDLVQRSASAHGGRPVKWLGDGVMLYFPRPEGAVRSALDLADGAPAAGLPPTHSGIDAGPVILQDGDYFGRTVNTAARIASRASAGQVLVSDNVVAECRDPMLTFEDLGPVELKGLSSPLSVHVASRSA